VVNIADGDTLTVLVERRQHRIRLEGIDCPESGQAYGTKAKKALADMIFGKTVKVEWQSKDRYRRILGPVYIGDRWIRMSPGNRPNQGIDGAKTHIKPMAAIITPMATRIQPG
jgi:endonuclease YncB( thermonuclease family)